MSVQLRARTEADLAILLPMLQLIHEREGYPVRQEAVSAEWLTSAAKPGVTAQPELGSWVAVGGGRVVGHVALHPPAGPCLPLWVEGTGGPASGIAVLSRLFTDRSARGAGTALMEHALAEAALRGLRAVLEVDALSPAYGLYLRKGWQEAGRAVQQWGHRTVDSVALVAPVRTSAGGLGTPRR